MSLILYVGNSNVIELQDLKNAATNAFDTGATVTVTIKDKAGNAVAGQTWPAAMSYVSGTNGTYRATLEDDIAIVAPRKYEAIVDVIGTGAEIAHFEAEVSAQVRKT